MDFTEADSDPSTLRQRIAALEDQLRVAQESQGKGESGEEDSEAAHKHAEHHHHAAANVAAYGHHPDVIFIEPGDEYQGLICRYAHNPGAIGLCCRLLVKYNIDQFLQRPVLRQWLQNGKVYREAGERVSSRFELFFDLLFVGIVHQISEGAAEEPTGIGFVKYVLTFTPAFSIWGDVRDMANQFANDDVTQRAYILWIMLLLVGYSNNATSIEWGVPEGGEGDSDVSTQSTVAMHWALGFFVVAKFSKVILNLVYAIFLPLSRKPLIFTSFNSVVTSILFLVAIFTPFHGTISLVAVGIASDYVLRIFGMMTLKTIEVLGKKRARARTGQGDDLTPGEKDGSGGHVYERSRTMDSSVTAINEVAPLGNNATCHEVVRAGYRIPAINIEHHVERLGAFVTIVLGEMVVNVFYKSTNATGLSAESGRALLGVMIAFNLNWMYFDSQACKHFVHALRRHWFTSFLFTVLHLPLCMSLLLASSAMNRLVISPSPSSDSGGGLKWFFGAGLGVSVCVMATIGVLHKSLDDEILAKRNPDAANMMKTKRTFSRRVVLATRYAAGLTMVLLPLAKDMDSVKYLGIYVAITAFLIIEETVARIERREWELEAKVNGKEGNV